MCDPHKETAALGCEAADGRMPKVASERRAEMAVGPTERPRYRPAKGLGH